MEDAPNSKVSEQSPQLVSLDESKWSAWSLQEGGVALAKAHKQRKLVEVVRAPICLEPIAERFLLKKRKFSRQTFPVSAEASPLLEFELLQASEAQRSRCGYWKQLL